MKQLIIIGGGFAGFWSAMSAIRQARILSKRDEVKITLISKDEYHSIRPRFYENNLEGLRLPLQQYLEPLGIEFIIGEVTKVNPEKREVILAARPAPLCYDCLILTTGSQLSMNNVPGIESAFDVDSYDAATRLHQHILDLSQSGFSTISSRNFIVVGGGFTGLEVVTSLPKKLRNLITPSGKNFNIYLIERGKSLAENYSAVARQYILEQLIAAKVTVILDDELRCIETGKIILKSGKIIDSDTVIMNTGLKASLLTEYFNGYRDKIGRLAVDSFLRLPAYNNVFAAGDVAMARVDHKNYSVMSCQHAIPQGKYAGHNAINTLFDNDMINYTQPAYQTCLDLGDVALNTTGWDRSVKAVGEEAKKLKREIVTQWIYPPECAEDAVKRAFPFNVNDISRISNYGL